MWMGMTERSQFVTSWGCWVRGFGFPGGRCACLRAWVHSVYWNKKGERVLNMSHFASSQLRDSEPFRSAFPEGNDFNLMLPWAIQATVSIFILEASTDARHGCRNDCGSVSTRPAKWQEFIYWTHLHNLHFLSTETPRQCDNTESHTSCCVVLMITGTCPF